jgi:hypothetical protein
MLQSLFLGHSSQVLSLDTIQIAKRVFSTVETIQVKNDKGRLPASGIDTHKYLN